MGPYHFYFVDANGHVAGREHFEADGDDDALLIAGAIRHACAEVYPHCELWEGDRRIVGDGRPIPPVSATQIRIDLQTQVLRTEEVIGASRAAIARSERFLLATARLRQALGAAGGSPGEE